MKKISLFLVAFMLIATSAFAASPWKDATSTGERMKQKFVYGLTNFALGWTEILQETGEAIQAKENIAVGLGRGIGNAIGDTVGGAVHLVTFFCKKTDVPLPEGGTDIIS